MNILIYGGICIVCFIAFILAVEKFFYYLDETEYPEAPDFVDEKGDKFYGY